MVSPSCVASEMQELARGFGGCRAAGVHSGVPGVLCALARRILTVDSVLVLDARMPTRHRVMSVSSAPATGRVCRHQGRARNPRLHGAPGLHVSPA